jgi:hypothetical protein
MTQTELLKYENHFPNCVSVKLIPKINVQTERNEQSSSSSLAINARQPVELELTIRFGLQEIEFPGGTVFFGLRRGELKVKLENGKMLMEEMGLVKPLQLEFSKEIQKETGFKGTLGEKSNVEASNKATEKEAYKEYAVHTKGTEEEPIWVFSSKSQDEMLSGQLTKESLGIIDVTNGLCKVRATFEIKAHRDLHITDYVPLDKYMRVKDISRNKIALFRRLFLLKVILKKVQLQPYLSRVEGQI